MPAVEVDVAVGVGVRVGVDVAGPAGVTAPAGRGVGVAVTTTVTTWTTAGLVRAVGVADPSSVDVLDPVAVGVTVSGGGLTTA